MFIIMLVITMLITKERLIFFSGDLKFMFWAILLMVPYFILHELLHSLAYRIHGAKCKNITFGAFLEKGVLCCLCKQNISRRAILTSLLYPFVILGVIAYILGLVFHSKLLLFLAILNISGCAADLMMFFGLRKIRNYDYTEFDDPTSFALYSEKDLSNKKMFGINYVGEKGMVSRRDYRKIVISRTSLIIFVLLLLLIIIMFTLFR